MNLNQITDMQKEFDSNHKGTFEWSQKIDDNNVELLEYLLLCLVGEVGETANLVKKILRGDFKLSDKKVQIGEEIADVFIYLLKLSYQLDIDLEKEYLSKLNINKLRFVNYEKKEA